MVPQFPTGTVTLVFTDIEGSSVLWSRYGAAFQPVLDDHYRLLQETASHWGGVEMGRAGDSLFLVFAQAFDAVQFAVEAQQVLAQQEWPVPLSLQAPEEGNQAGVKLRVRIGMHTGEPLFRRHPDGVPDYVGLAVNLASRVSGAGHGGQILLSGATHQALPHPELPSDLTFRDCGVHRLKDMGEERLWQVHHPDLPQEFPPLRTLLPELHNLPSLSAPFIGRQEEIAAWEELLRQPTTRLLTLTGLGGIGKTRAALRLAELSLKAFPDGTWWVELAEARTGGELAPRIAARLPLHLQPQSSVKEQLWAFLRERQLLLVLDNTEQIPDAAAVVHELLSAAPRLKCLVTSRQALGLQAERVVEVLPLPLPPRTEAGTEEQYASVALFVERARARQADFALTPDNAEDVAELCRRLEGVPLAIELAASRIDGLTVREILHRLTDRFRVLQTRISDLPPRHRALRAVMDWSYDLLADRDRELFAQLGVFAGGFTMADAEQVCDAPEVLEGVLELRRHSLLRTEADPATQQTRYSLLETVREYALEKGRNVPMEVRDNLLRRHAEHYLQLAEHQAAQERTSAEAASLRRMEREFDNVRSAFLWSSDAGETELCARLSLALGWFLERRGFWREALQFIQMGLDTLGPLPDAERGDSAFRFPSYVSRLLYRQASLYHDLGDLPRARRLAEESLTMYRSLNDPAGTAQVLNLLGLIARREALPHEARVYFEESLRLRRGLGDVTGAAMCLTNLGLLANDRGEPEAARRFHEESLALAEEAGNQRGIAEAQNNLGVLSFQQEDFATARRCYTEALRMERDLGHKLGMATALFNLGEVAERQGDIDSAVLCFAAAERWFAELGSPWATHPADALTRLGQREENVNPEEVIARLLEE